MMVTDLTRTKVRRVPLLALWLTLILLVLASCAPISDTEPTAEPVDPTRSSAGLNTVEPSQDPPDGGTADHEVTSVPDGAGEAEGEIATPVIIDLGEVTAGEAGASETLQEMPQPGIPDPSAAISQKAAADLAERLDIDVSQVALVSVEEAEWPDSSLGCPESGESYLAVETTGYIIVFEANGERSEYHADHEGRIVHCENDN